MISRSPDIAFIGFGEAAMAFADGIDCVATGFDRQTGTTKRNDFTRLGVAQMPSNSAAVERAPVVLSLVTAAHALAAAVESARHIPAGALYCDMNSVAPDTKRAASAVIEAAGGRYVDVAVMAPVHPARRTVPLLVGGPHARAAVTALAEAGFTRITEQPGPVGAASAIKMIRSVMIKGIEALSVECALAAHAAGVLDAVVASLDASWPGADWEHRFDYNLDRMLVHGTRRAAEMEEVVRTLDALGDGAAMSRATITRQRAIGALGLTPPDDLTAKLTAIATQRTEHA